MNIREESLQKHYEWNGKIEVIAKAKVNDSKSLSLAYTPGVAEPCLEIQKDYNKSYELTRRNNLVAVITDGSAVLGLGDIGPEAGMPVMEGKCVLFKEFGDVDAFPLCVRTKDVDEFVQTVYNISGSFGGINLEDISAPRCFEIEEKLKKMCDIPIFHDDQHGTAVVVNRGMVKGGLKDAIVGTDIFIGVSAPGVLTEDMIKTMHKDPIVLAMANPTPEIMPDEAKAAGAKIVGTGRSDFPNQINNVVAFPGIFRGALDVRASAITENMKIAAAYAIASLVDDDKLNDDYILPYAFDERIKDTVANAVAEAARKDGVARI